MTRKAAHEKKGKLEKIIYQADEDRCVPNLNGRVEFLGKQTLNENGNIILDVIGKHKLIMLNDDPICNGTIICVKGNQTSVIDYSLANEKMYKINFRDMTIYGNNDIFYLSDHTNKIKMPTLHGEQKLY